MAIRGRPVEDGGFLFFVLISTLALGLVAGRFVGALLWAALAALMFQPLFQRLLARWPSHRNRAAAASLAIITVAVVIPALTVTSLVIEEAAGVYARIRSGGIDFAQYFQQMHDALPLRLRQLLDTWGFGSFERAQGRLSDAARGSASMLAGRAVAIGADAAAFLLSFGVSLYVTYFLLRDGEHLTPKIVQALPLERSIADRIVERLTAVIRATVKGSGVVALVQGALGAATFWIVGLPAALLWGLLMTIAALLPAIGPAIIWVPVALYLVATGAIWQAAAVVVSGVIVIGLADNILRPILVGRNTGLPDWVVLVTTLGGIDLLGISGIIVGPLAAALCISAWSILTEQRLCGSDLRIDP